jgi:hypothetical protein
MTTCTATKREAHRKYRCVREEHPGDPNHRGSRLEFGTADGDEASAVAVFVDPFDQLSWTDKPRKVKT